MFFLIAIKNDQYGIKKEFSRSLDKEYCAFPYNHRFMVSPTYSAASTEYSSYLDRSKRMLFKPSKMIHNLEWRDETTRLNFQ